MISITASAWAKQVAADDSPPRQAADGFKLEEEKDGEI